MFLAVLLVLFLSLLFILHLYISSTLPSPKPHGIFSLPAAYTSFSSYLSLSNAELTRMRASYASISHSHKKLGYSIGYPAKLNRLAEIYQRNAKITRSIAALAELQFPNELGKSGGSGVNSPWWWGSWFTNRTTSQFASTASLVRVRESLKHFVRDWSTDGAIERKVIFTPVLDVLRYLSSSSTSTSPFTSGPYKSLLIPGSGLSRLAYESSLLGFHTTACELSMFMNLAFRFLLDESTTSQINQHEVHPYAHWLSHQRVSWQDDSESAFRSVKFPDVVPSLRDAEVKGGSLELVEGDFLTLSKPQQQRQHSGQQPIDPNPNFPSSFPSPSSSSTGNGTGTGGYDILLTLFFIDTSPNILSTLSHIHHLLRPGGIWINLGPLLYTSSALGSYPGSGGGSRLELSLDGIVRVGRGLGMDVVGFGEDGRKRKKRGTGEDGDGEEEEEEGEGEEEGIPECMKPRTICCEYTADKSTMMRWIYEAEFFVARKVC
ncbi:N2227-domain-containing protein [Dendrothele bispora CBS 962.96]|uniref:N2227-domain-containing protein n=1 Tax=Dendrothele bispora (strain CBS 962.96) TaxID=1314807 RepID=A0A4S8MSX1_DENBC|nr:N2227-domain-containing protein [Dendrothele bispora CBS 962.96]